jgi:PEP-CTERM motif
MRQCHFRIVLVLAVASFLAASGARADTTINFDFDPNSNPIASGTNVSNTYASLGVTFSFTACTAGSACFGITDTPKAIANTNAASTPNVIGFSSLFGGVEAQVGGIRANFSSLQNSVSIDVQTACNGQDNTCFTNSDPAYLAAYTSGGVLVGTMATSTLSGNGAPEQLLSVSGPGMAYVQFGTLFGDTESQIGYFDNLTFGPGSGGGGGTTGVPEPSTLLLSSLGFAALALKRFWA